MVRLKGVYERDSRQVLRTFQFHYGTIKRKKDTETVDARYLPFNSTMVRLKEMEKRLQGYFVRAFNSTMVRLKAERLCRPRLLDCFQFHYGTIKRSNPEGCKFTVTAFNSTMVRLKAVPSCLPALFLGAFNSTMVRLKVRFLQCFVRLHFVFQFHYGTIKRFCRNHIQAKSLFFQFHYGTIKSFPTG